MTKKDNGQGDPLPTAQIINILNRLSTSLKNSNHKLANTRIKIREELNASKALLDNSDTANEENDIFKLR